MEAVGYLTQISPYASGLSGSANAGRVVMSGGLCKWRHSILSKHHQPSSPRRVLFVIEYLRLIRKHDPCCYLLHSPPFSTARTDIGSEEANFLRRGYRLDDVRPAYLV